MKRLTARFYVTANGSAPVREWLLGLSTEDRRIVGRDLARVEFGWPIGMPVCRPLDGGLWETRSTILSGKVEARVYFAIEKETAVLLNGHEGKRRQAEEMALARARWTDLKRRRGEGGL